MPSLRRVRSARKFVDPGFQKIEGKLELRMGRIRAKHVIQAEAKTCTSSKSEETLRMKKEPCVQGPILRSSIEEVWIQCTLFNFHTKAR